MSDSIKVVVRARPLKKHNNEPWWVIDNRTIYQIDDDKTVIGDTYSYDEVFDVEAKNVDIYDTAISSLVPSAIEGINLTIFAYGATSSGKTYTMNGISEDPGMIPRFIEHLFGQIELYSHRKFLIRVSYVEIYSEVINDLLDKNNKDLKVREDTNSCVSYNAKEQIVKSSAECMKIMTLGTCNRTVGETNMNLFSSRSHSIFRLVIESVPTTNDENDPVQVSHVNLIDLAGSERVAQTGTTGQRFKEGAHINKSLTALGLVIKQLVEKAEYVNYRDSKLTRILSNSLGGNAKTLIICNVNLGSIEDTASTLMFAQRAKAVKNKPKVNEIITEAALTKRYAKESADIKKLLEVEFEKNKLLEDEREMRNKKIEDLQSRIKSLQELFVKKEAPIKHPKRRHTFCTLGAISEEREVENTTKNLLSSDLRINENTSIASGFISPNSSQQRDSIATILDSGKSMDATPPKHLRNRLEILTRDYEELTEYTKKEKLQMTLECRKLLNECQAVQALSEEKDKLLKSVQEKADQIKIDYEFLLETQQNKFQRRERELLEQINKSSSTVVEDDAPISIENLPIPTNMAMNIFEYEEMSEKIESLKQQNEEYHKNAQSLKLENEELCGLIADLRKSVNTLELQNSQLKIKNKSLQSKVVDMEVKANKSQHVVDSSNENVGSLRNKIEESETTIKELKSELDKVRNDLYESQDKLVDITQDLDIEEKKSSTLEQQLSREKKTREELETKFLAEVEAREEAELRITKERELRREADSNLSTEIELRQKTESELSKEIELRQKTESELSKEKELRLESESKLAEKSQLSKDDESNMTEEKSEKLADLAEMNSQQVEQTKLRKDIELKLVEENKLRQKSELELMKVKELLKEAQIKLAKEVDLRQEAMLDLCTLRNILEPKSQHSEHSNKTLNNLKESMSGYQSTMEESELDMSDLEKSSNYTEESLNQLLPPEIDPENLVQFSSSYFQDTSKSTNFMSFFNSLVHNDNEVLPLKGNSITISEQKEPKNDCSMNEVEKLQKDLNTIKLQRESDIFTIKKLQAQLEEYTHENLSDSEKINKSNEISQALNSLEVEKAENLLLIQNLKEQCQTNKANHQELQNEFKIKNDELKMKSEEIQKLLIQIETLNEEVRFHKDNLDEQFIDLEREKVTNLMTKVQSQTKRLQELDEIIEDKELTISKLTEENEFSRKELESTNFLLVDERKKNESLSCDMERLKFESKNLQKLVETKEMSISEINTEKIILEKERNTLNSKVIDLLVQIEQNEIKFQNIMKENEFLREAQKQTLLNIETEREKNANLSCDIANLKLESENLSSLLEQKNIIIANIEDENMKLEGEKNEINEEVEDLLLQVGYDENDEIFNDDDDKFANLLKKITEWKNEITILRRSVQDKNEMIENMRNYSEKGKDDLSDKINTLMIQNKAQINQIDAQNIIIKEKELAIQEKNQQIQNYINEIDYMRPILREENERNTVLSNNLDEHKIEMKNLFSSLEEKEIAIVKIKAEKYNLEEEINILSTKVEELSKLIEKSDEKVNRQSEILENKEFNLKKLLNEFELFKEENGNHLLALKSEIIQNQNLSKELEKLKEDNRDLSLSLHEQKETITRINKEKENLKKEKEELIAEKSNSETNIVKELREQLSCISEQKDAIISSLEYEKEKGKLLQQINDLRNEAETNRNQIQKLYELSTENELYKQQLEIEHKSIKEDMETCKSLLMKEKEELSRLKESEESLKRTNNGLMENMLKQVELKTELENQIQDLRAEISDKLGDHIKKIRDLFGIEDKKDWKAWAHAQKLETRLQELENIEKLVSSFVKGRTDQADYKEKLEKAVHINKELMLQLQSHQNQTNFLRKMVDEKEKECEKSKSENEKHLQMVNNKLKTLYVTHEQDKKKIENLEYELQTMSKKVKNSNHNGEKSSSELRNTEDKWKQQRTREHDSRRSIDLNTLCAESTVNTCNCENKNKSTHKMKMEISQMKDELGILRNKYEKMKTLCRLRNDEIQQLKKITLQ